VNAITLRAWERRYGLIKPARTQSGHRLYTRTDIDIIHRIVALLDKGIAIGQVRAALAAPRRAPSGRAATGPGSGYVERMISAIRQFDETRLEDTYNEALAQYRQELVTRNVLLPLLTKLGERWVSAEGSVAEEHFFSVYLRNKLGARFHHRTRDSVGPRLLCACLPGEHHEAGLLLFALAAHERGYHIVLLGADMPLAELPVVVRRAHCAAIVLSGFRAQQPALLEQELPQLVRNAAVPVFVGGLMSINARDRIVAAGAEPLGTDLGVGLKRIGNALGVAA
jgi:DNA-binding transcriptional MerR regulator